MNGLSELMYANVAQLRKLSGLEQWASPKAGGNLNKIIRRVIGQMVGAVGSGTPKKEGHSETSHGPKHSPKGKAAASGKRPLEDDEDIGSGGECSTANAMVETPIKRSKKA